MVNYSKHSASLGTWTGAADAHRKVQAQTQTLMQVEKLRQQNEQTEVRQMQADQKHLSDVTEKTKWILANVPHLRAEVQDVWESKKSEIKQDIINNHNGDTNSWMNSGGHDYIMGLSESITDVIPETLRGQVTAYVDATTNPTTRGFVTNTDHRNFEDFKSGTIRNYEFKGLLGQLSEPTKEDKDYAISQGGDISDAYLGAGSNYNIAKQNYILEHDLPNNAEVSYETLKAYVADYHQHKTPVQAGISSKDYSYSNSITSRLDEMKELTIDDIDNIGDNPNYQSLIEYLDINPGLTPGVTPKGVELSSVIGQSVMDGRDGKLWASVFGQEQYLPPQKRWDDDSGQYVLLPGRITTKTDGLNYYDANGYKMEQGALVDNFIAQGVYIGYEFDTAKDGARLLTADNRDEYFGDDSTKTLRPVLIAEMVGDVGGREDNAHKFLFFGRQDETTAIYRKINLTGINAQQFDDKMKVKKDVSKEPTKNQIKKLTDAKNVGNPDENIDAMKGTRSYILGTSTANLLNNKDMVSIMDNYVAMISNPIDSQLKNSGIDGISLTNKSALLSSIYVDMLNTLETHGEEMNVNGQTFDTGAISLQAIVESLPNVVANQPKLKNALLSNDVQNYYNIVYNSYYHSDSRTAESNTDMVKKIAKLIESSYINLYN